MRICKIEGCENKHVAKGYCNKHYLKFWEYGDPHYKKNEQHGMRYTPEYQIWANIKDRCHNKKNSRYYRYGVRGIVICDRWKNSFIAFFKDMGAKPFPKAEIDRIDNDGNYEPGNCRWVSHTKNNRNRTTIKLTTEKADEIRKRYKLDNITHKELGLVYGISRRTIGHIIQRKIWK